MTTRYAMTSFDFQQRHTSGQLATILRTLKLQLPPEILAGNRALSDYDAEQLINKVLPAHDYIADAGNAALAGEDPSKYMALAASDYMRQAVRNYMVNVGDHRYVELINTNASKIIKSIRKEVFDPAITELRTLHENNSSGTWDLDQAITDGDFMRAELIKQAGKSVRLLSLCFDARVLLHPGGFDGSAGWALEPSAWDAVGEPRPESLTFWMSMLDMGFTPVFGTIDEWLKLFHSEEHAEYREGLGVPQEKHDFWLGERHFK